MRLSDARHELRAIGVSIKSTGYGGEYRVARMGPGNEAAAYYTDDLRDAVSTARRQWGR